MIILSVENLILTLEFSSIRAHWARGHEQPCSNRVFGATKAFPRGQELEGHLCFFALFLEREGTKSRLLFWKCHFRKTDMWRIFQGASVKASRCDFAALDTRACEPLLSEIGGSPYPYWSIVGKEYHGHRHCLLRVCPGKSCRQARIRQWGWVWSLSELTNSSHHFRVDMTQTLLCPEHLFFSP